MWDAFALQLDMPGGIGGAAHEGMAVIRYQDRLVESAVSHAREITLAGHRVPAVNTTVLMSEIGHRLSQGRPFSATYFISDEGKVVWSLRSTDQGIDVSEVAKQYGGGGHRNAAGFKADLAVIMGMIGSVEVHGPYIA